MPLSFSLSSSFICLCLTLIKGDDKEGTLHTALVGFLFQIRMRALLFSTCHRVHIVQAIKRYTCTFLSAENYTLYSHKHALVHAHTHILAYTYRCYSHEKKHQVNASSWIPFLNKKPFKFSSFQVNYLGQINWSPQPSLNTITLSFASFIILNL